MIIDNEILSRKIADYVTDNHGYEDIRIFILNILKSLTDDLIDAGRDIQRNAVNEINLKLEEKRRKDFTKQKEMIHELILTKIKEKDKKVIENLECVKN
jgi:hypothetical protein